MTLANIFRRTYRALTRKAPPAPFIREEVLEGLRFAASVMGV